MEKTYAAGIKDLDVKREMALFFSKFGPTRATPTLYHRLYAHIKERGLIDSIVSSTLNYECMLEYGAGTNGFETNYVDLDAGRATIWKLHGSCNFFIMQGKGGGAIHVARGSRVIGGEWDFVPALAVPYRLKTSGFGPIMSMYARGKPTLVAEDFLDGIQRRWARRLRRSDYVAVVGVRPNAADKHIWGPLALVSSRIGFIGDRNALDSWWAVADPSAEKDFLGPTFEAGLPELLRRLE